MIDILMIEPSFIFVRFVAAMKTIIKPEMFENSISPAARKGWRVNL